LLSEQHQATEAVHCIQCGASNAVNVKFCSNCGYRQEDTATDETAHNWQLLKQAALFYGIYIVVCALSSFVDYFKTVGWFLVVEIIGAGTAVLFFTYNWNDYKKQLRWPSFSWQKLAAYGSIAMASNLLIHYISSWINIVIFSRDYYYYSIFAGMPGAAYLIIFFTAITPALFEELGFRGYLLQSLLNIADTGQAVFISAFLFGIIHLNFVSLFWLIPFALFLGYVRVKENTIWYGVFFHFCFNLTACLFELL
jgi:membrane protease YdiL (CAAX protease family)